jgi:hypothetical protein
MIMGIDLLKSSYISELSSSLYSWLPGSSPPFGRTYTFGEIAHEYGLVWISGSKLPALQNLLEQAEKKSVLPKVVLGIINHGHKYRNKKNEPVDRHEVETIKSIMMKLGYKIPELIDEKFLSSLSSLDLTKIPVDRVKLIDLNTKYYQMKKNPDSQSRGYEFQSFLAELFKLWRLDPRKAFRITGEEIDGSIELDKEIYLLEARWRTKPADRDDLIIFSTKVGNKSEWTRGIFVSVNGYDEEALHYLESHGKLNFIAVRGNEIEKILKGEIDTIDLIRKRVRISAEEKKFYFAD